MTQNKISKEELEKFFSILHHKIMIIKDFCETQVVMTYHENGSDIKILEALSTLYWMISNDFFSICGKNGHFIPIGEYETHKNETEISKVFGDYKEE